MIYYSSDHTVTPRVPREDGKPGGTIRWLVPEEILEESGRCFTVVTVLPGAQIPKHQHVGEFELFYVVSGSGIYWDNEQACRVRAGDCMFCKENEFHALENDGQEDVVLVAFCGYPRKRPPKQPE